MYHSAKGWPEDASWRQMISAPTSALSKFVISTVFAQLAFPRFHPVMQSPEIQWFVHFWRRWRRCHELGIKPNASTTELYDASGIEAFNAVWSHAIAFST